MEQEVTCPHCQAVFDVPLEYLGLQGLCPDCQSTFVLQLAGADTQPPSLPSEAPKSADWDEDFGPDSESDWYDNEDDDEQESEEPFGDPQRDRYQDELTWAGTAESTADNQTGDRPATDDSPRGDLASDRAEAEFQFPAPQTSASRFPMAVVVGMFTGGLAAVVWGALSFATGTKQGYLMLVIALVVSRSIRSVYDNSSGTARLAAGGITLVSCLLGNLMIGVFIEARQKNMAVLALLEMLQVGDAVRILQQTFSPTDLLLYLISFSMAYKGAQQDPTVTRPAQL